MNRNTKRGFLSLEASIFLPIFIIAVLTFGYLIKVVVASENIMHVMADETRRLSMYSYNIKLAPLFTGRLESRILEENRDIDDVKVETFKYLYSGVDKEDLIGIRVSSEVKIKLPIVFQDNVMLTDTLLVRAFTGREFKAEHVDYENMEEEKEVRIVWVFPTAGTRYHEEFCGYINVAARQGVLNSDITKNYNPCTHCGSSQLAHGSLIYYFITSGSVYHRASCFIVDRYVISMDEDDAISKGYLPCSRCI